MSQTEQHCALRLAAEGRREVCARERCPFWEPGGAVVPGSCLLERLAVDLSRPELARYLLKARRRLERARDSEEGEEAHREFARRLGRDV